ncbi:response regulator [Algirhabdus cladophorae]|uniref:response regulator n=1 Tax=Algirhabdus cladophorae TaxID=3377108 RepID=UPI003B849980
MDQELPKTKEVRFLIVDDDRVSIMALQRSLRKLRIVNELEIAKDGLEALSILNASVEAEGRLLPYIVILDLNMPRMNGFEFLEKIRSDPMLNKLIIFVLTTSDTPRDVSSAYEKNVAGYIVKDNPKETLWQALEMINAYSRLVEMP